MGVVSGMALAGLLGSAAVSGLSAFASARNTRKARDEEQAAYERNKLALDADLYRSPLESISNKALLKTMDERLRDMRDAEENRAAAGGATMENRLAAMDSANQTLSGTYTNLLLGEDARQQHIRNQQLALENQHSQNVANNYLQNAQNWQQWGAATSQAFGNLGSAFALGGFGTDDVLLQKPTANQLAHSAHKDVQDAMRLQGAYNQYGTNFTVSPTGKIVPGINVPAPALGSPAAILDGDLRKK